MCSDLTFIAYYKSTFSRGFRQCDYEKSVVKIGLATFIKVEHYDSALRDLPATSSSDSV